ncbi:Rhodanese-related sulfurtransferase [Alteromonadaceae bacterium Bs31]|nr:Rhodanese-related sulfurtransferase [Alteromonadaceae bacterium Bs31]
MNKFKRISVDEADQILLASPDAILVDSRDKNSYGESHHPRALLFDDKLFRSLLKSSEKNIPVVVYCYHGNNSQDIAKLFADFGFKDCYSVDGGYAAWRYQIASDFPASQKLEKWLNAQGTSSTDINARLDAQYRTPLMLAAKKGNTDIVKDLIEAGANPNLTDIDGNNALWYACLGQNILCVTTLINADVEVDNQNNQGFSPLNYAVGIDEIFNLLSNYFESDPLLQLNQASTTETTPHYAASLAC